MSRVVHHDREEALEGSRMDQQDGGKQVDTHLTGVAKAKALFDQEE